jgi:hypothetical protein
MYRGTLTAGDIWAQHNEHRIFFPKLLMLGLARVTHWSIKYELAVNIVLAAGILCLLARQLRQTARALEWQGLLWTIPAASVVVFSLSQYENFLWGWQIAMWLNMLTVLGGIMLLGNPTFSPQRIAFALLLGIVATYSFADGILYWPIGFCLLLWGHRERPARKTRKLPETSRARQSNLALTAWAMTSLLAVFFYFWHYKKPVDHPPLAAALKAPLDYVAYVFSYLGNPFGQISLGEGFPSALFALAWGFLGSAMFAWSLWFLLRRKAVRVELLLPYLGMSAYSVGSAVVTGLGRVGFGQEQALHPVTALWSVHSG